MPDPLVSVIIPAYNGERFLREAVDSALAQTYPNIEVIVVNDGSTDNTVALLSGYGDRIRVFHQNNAGQAAARNLGISKSTGQWIAFLDQDDLWDPRKLAVQIQEARERDSVVHSNIRVVDASGHILQKSHKTLELRQSPSLAELLTCYHISMCTVVVRREAFLAAGGFDASNRLGTDDLQFWLYLAATGHEFHYLHEVLASYRRHEANFSLDDARRAKGALYAIEQTRRRYPHAFTREVLRACRKYLQSVDFSAGWRHFHCGDYREAAGFFLQSAAYRPFAVMPWVYLAASHMPFRGFLIPRLRTFLRWCRRET